MQLYQALITLDGWTFLAQICNLMIQLVIFKKLLLNPVKKVIAERKAKADKERGKNPGFRQHGQKCSGHRRDAPRDTAGLAAVDGHVSRTTYIKVPQRPSAKLALRKFP